jgi:hypothetical protein
MLCFLKQPDLLFISKLDRLEQAVRLRVSLAISNQSVVVKSLLWLLNQQEVLCLHRNATGKLSLFAVSSYCSLFLFIIFGFFLFFSIILFSIFGCYTLAKN